MKRGASLAFKNSASLTMIKMNGVRWSLARGGARRRWRLPHLAFALVRGCLVRLYSESVEMLTRRLSRHRRTSPIPLPFFEAKHDAGCRIRAREDDRSEGVRHR